MLIYSLVLAVVAVLKFRIILPKQSVMITVVQNLMTCSLAMKQSGMIAEGLSVLRSFAAVMEVTIVLIKQR